VLPRDDAVVFLTVDAVYSVSRLKQTQPDVVAISRNVVAPTGNAYAIFPSTRPDRFWVALHADKCRPESSRRCQFFEQALRV
jgi:hypothetical protein